MLDFLAFPRRKNKNIITDTLFLIYSLKPSSTLAVLIIPLAGYNFLFLNAEARRRKEFIKKTQRLRASAFKLEIQVI